MLRTELEGKTYIIKLNERIEYSPFYEHEILQMIGRSLPQIVEHKVFAVFFKDYFFAGKLDETLTPTVTVDCIIPKSNIIKE